MKRIGQICMLVGLLLSHCVACTVFRKSTPVPSPTGLTLSDFQFLKLGMSFEQVVAEVGEPDRDIGSGVYLFQYDLADGRKITLQFIRKDELSGVWVVSRDGQWESWKPGVDS